MRSSCQRSPRRCKRFRRSGEGRNLGRTARLKHSRWIPASAGMTRESRALRPSSAPALGRYRRQRSVISVFTEPSAGASLGRRVNLSRTATNNPLTLFSAPPIFAPVSEAHGADGRLVVGCQGPLVGTADCPPASVGMPGAAEGAADWRKGMVGASRK